LSGDVAPEVGGLREHGVGALVAPGCAELVAPLARDVDRLPLLLPIGERGHGAVELGVRCVDVAERGVCDGERVCGVRCVADVLGEEGV
jgi:hypothetical protein